MSDALVLLGKRLDQKYLQTLHDTLELQIALSWQDTAVYSFDSIPPEVALAQLRADMEDRVDYREGPIAYRSAQINNVPYRVVQLGMPSQDRGPLTLYLFQPTALEAESMWIAIAQVIGISLTIMLVGSAFAYLFTRRVTRPLRQLAYAAQTIAGGHFEQSVPATSPDEVGELARAFENMRVQIRAMLQAQQHWNADLEDKVRAKTAELEALGEVRDQLMRRMITAKEEECRRVARELHDETLQSLTALSAHLTALEKQTPPESQPRLAQVNALAVEILREVNRIVLNLRPRILDDQGLIPALKWYARERLESTGVGVEVSVTGRAARLPADTETILFRVGQEAITNIAKHAHARHARLNVVFDADASRPTVTLQIEDDGDGFDLAQQGKVWEPAHPRFGVLGMKERLQVVGGTFDLRSAPGEGT